MLMSLRQGWLTATLAVLVTALTMVACSEEDVERNPGTGGTTASPLGVSGAPVKGRWMSVSAGPSAEPVYFMGGCGAASGGPSLLPWIVLLLGALWAFSRRHARFASFERKG